MRTCDCTVLTGRMEGDGDDGVFEAKNVSAHTLGYVPHPHLPCNITSHHITR